MSTSVSRRKIFPWLGDAIGWSPAGTEPILATQGLKQAKIRQRYVLERMVDEHFISYAQAMDAWQEPIKLSRLCLLLIVLALYYIEHVRQFLEKRYGGTATYQLGFRFTLP